MVQCISMSKTYSLAELVEMLQVHRNTITAWLKRGMPYVQKAEAARGQPWQFNLADVVRWREDQAALAAVGDTSELDIQEARRRKTAAEAALVELDLALRKKEIVKIETISEIVGDEYANCRAKLLAIPSKLAPALEITEGIPEKRDIIEAAIVEALQELASDGSDFSDTDNVAEESSTPSSLKESKAASEVDRKPVGGRAPKAKPRSKRRAGEVENIEG